ncbi:uncharacterized protein LOC119280161 [Triticum dicoccoides]|uniref:uncharacterized protein LOC119280161 n=1 Tax=Triticum dicoccoides TaxID=85692 RepID=UPI00188F6F12|nr:uncharacterized protein LOC119280161 [Triticum dicoccoides]
MSSSAKHGTTTTSSSSIDPAETASSSSYFLPELIPLVASRLTTLQDFFALRGTCRTYRALLPLSQSNLASQAPLLLVPHKASSSEALFHIPLRRILRFRLPRTPLAHHDPNNAEFHSFGCRVAIEDSDAMGSHLELQICHLLTGQQVRLPDPPKDYEGIIFAGDLVLTFNRYYHTVRYCRIGGKDNDWRAARCAEGYGLRDLISLNGTLYALIFPNYCLAVVELDNSYVVLSFLGGELSAETVENSSMLRLAECRGELLLISAVRYPVGYQVFQWQSGDRKWVRTTALGGCSLFFNILQFAGCLGPDHPAVQGNCLYIIKYNGQCIKYSLVDGSSHELVADYPGQPRAWVLPSIC